MNAPKKPVQPWIPPRAPLPASVVTRVVRREAPSANGVIKAGWWFCILCGLLLGGLATVMAVAMHAKNDALEMAGAVAMMGGYYVALVLWAVGGIVHAVLCIVAMVRGAVARGLFLLLVGPLVAVALAVGPPLLVGLLAEKGRIVIKEEASEPPKEIAVKPVADAASSALRVTEIIEDAEKLLKVRDEEVFQAARSEAFRRAAGADVLEEHREPLRSRLRAMFAAAEIERSRPRKLPR